MKIGLIGCGKMGSALLKGMLSAEPDMEAVIHDSHAPTAEALTSDRVRAAEGLNALVSDAEVIILCVKPNDVEAALTASGNWEGKLLLSIAAGVSINTLTELTEGKADVIRVMPNTPAMIGQGASAFSRGHSVSDKQAATAHKLLSSVGTVSEVGEHLMNAVTGLSGSGPAYVYTIVEALADAGVKQGLPRNVALQLATQTLKGAVMLVEESGQHPAVLRDQVTSPGGTTIEGLAALEEHGLRHALFSAVEAATIRSEELG